MASEARADNLQRDKSNTASKLNESNLQLIKVRDEKASMQKENEMMQKEYALIQKNLMMRSSESKMTIAEQARRLSNLQDIIDSQTEITTRLKK